MSKKITPAPKLVIHGNVITRAREINFVADDIPHKLGIYAMKSVPVIVPGSCQRFNRRYMGWLFNIDDNAGIMLEIGHVSQFPAGAVVSINKPRSYSKNKPVTQAGTESSQTA